MPDYATPENFEAWRQEAKNMTVEVLRHTIQDCRNAEKAMRGWNPVKEGFYSDQASTYGMELMKRGGKKWILHLKTFLWLQHHL